MLFAQSRNTVISHSDQYWLCTPFSA